jgi:hypothetical protein
VLSPSIVISPGAGSGRWGPTDRAGLRGRRWTAVREPLRVSRATTVQDLQLALYAEASRRGWAEGKFALPCASSRAPAAAAELWRCQATSSSMGSRPTGLAATLAALRAGPSPFALANKGISGGRRRAGNLPHVQVRFPRCRRLRNTRRWRNAFAVAPRQRSIGYSSLQAAVLPGLSREQMSNVTRIRSAHPT